LLSWFSPKFLTDLKKITEWVDITLNRLNWAVAFMRHIDHNKIIISICSSFNVKPTDIYLTRNLLAEEGLQILALRAVLKILIHVTTLISSGTSGAYVVGRKFQIMSSIYTWWTYLWFKMNLPAKIALSIHGNTVNPRSMHGNTVNPRSIHGQSTVTRSIHGNTVNPR